MAQSSGPADGDERRDTDQGSPAESSGHQSRRQRKHAAELSDRAAEYVDRRYDATKEIYLDERERRHDREREPDDTDTYSDSDSDSGTDTGTDTGTGRDRGT